MDVAYLYLLREDYLEDICKIGKTKQKCCTKINRFNAYDKETEIIALREVPIESLDELEKIFIKDFKTKYKVAKGNEYFHCTRNQALETFDSFVDTHIKNCEGNQIISLDNLPNTLQILYCSCNQIISLDNSLLNCRNLREFYYIFLNLFKQQNSRQYF